MCLEVYSAHLHDGAVLSSCPVRFVVPPGFCQASIVAAGSSIRAQTCGAVHGDPIQGTLKYRAKVRVETSREPGSCEAALEKASWRLKVGPESSLQLQSRSGKRILFLGDDNIDSIWGPMRHVRRRERGDYTT